MKSKKIVASLLALSMLSSFALAGCGSKGETSKDGENAGNDNASTSEAQEDADQYLNVLLGQEPKTLDPSKSTDLYSSQILANTMESLTRITQDENGTDKIVEGMAESWEQSEDGLTWTFHLRDAKWSDGEAVTAEQFVYGIKRTLNPETASAYAFLLYPIKGATEYNTGSGSEDQVGVKAVDDKTVEFTLSSPCAYFLDLTYFKVMEPQRQDIVEKAGDTYGSEADTMVFCGPFTIQTWEHNSKVELVKNDSYWDADSVKLSKVTMKVIAETNAVMQELYAGSLDMAGVNKPEWIQKFDESGNYQCYTGYEAATSYTYFNTAEEVNGEKNIFSNVKVRQAFSIATDREGIIQTLSKGLGDPAYSFVPPKVQIDGKDYRDLVNDLPVKNLIEENSDAKALLVEGLKELGLGDDPSKVTVTYLFAGTDTTAKEWAEYEQNMYESALGINMEIQYIEWAQYLTLTDQGEFQMASQAWSGDYNDPNTFLDFWASNAGMVNNAWKNDEYDECIATAASSTDATKRTEAFKRAEEILTAEDCVVVPTNWRVKKTYVANYVKNYTSPLFGTVDFKTTYTAGRK